MKLLTYALLAWGSLGFVAMAQDGRVMQAYPPVYAGCRRLDQHG